MAVFGLGVKLRGLQRVLSGFDRLTRAGRLPGGVSLSVGFFLLDRGVLPDRGMGSLGVEPEHPLRPRDLHVVDRAPWPLDAYQLGLIPGVESLAKALSPPLPFELRRRRRLLQHGPARGLAAPHDG